MTQADPNSGRGQWESLTATRSSMISRKEAQAAATIPSVLPDDNYNVENEALTNGSTSLGAQGATNIVNKLMLAMFAPGISFMKLSLAEDYKRDLMAEMGLTDDAILTDILAAGERSAMEAFEQSGSRPALFEGLASLTCVGDVMMDLSDDAAISFIPIHDYAVKRNRKGRVIRQVHREKTTVQDLEPEAQAEYRRAVPYCKHDDDVTIYTVVKLVRGMYRSTVWVEDVQLSQRHSGKWTPENMPFRALTWRLPMGQSYGVSLAEDYSNDLGTHDMISEALSDGAVLASQFRWACNPSGLTQPEDVERSSNGAVIPANKNDLDLVFANIGQQLATVIQIEDVFARRIGRGFLMNTAVTRNAERVTVEEVRIQAQELETSLGGVYSRLAIDMQAPIARWMLRAADISVKGTKIKPTVITGLDALSRTAELERLMGFLNDVTALSGIPPETRDLLNEEPIISAIAAGRGVSRTDYVASKEAVAERRQAREQELANRQAVQAGVNAGTAQLAQQGA